MGEQFHNQNSARKILAEAERVIYQTAGIQQQVGEMDLFEVFFQRNRIWQREPNDKSRKQNPD
jgi:hypothetical protein